MTPFVCIVDHDIDFVVDCAAIASSTMIFEVAISSEHKLNNIYDAQWKAHLHHTPDG